jgi:hypothetical protein
LKNLSTNENENEIMDYLTKLKIESLKFVKVSRFSTPKSRKEKRILPLFIVQISPESETNQLYKIEFLNNQRITWEKLRKDDIIQCHRCQRFGHAAPNCHLEYRCVKCKENHNPGECKLGKEENNKENENQPYCVLCKTTGHPASFKGCVEYQKIKLKLQAKRNELKNRRVEKQPVTTSFRNENQTFANLFKHDESKTTNNDNIAIISLLEEMNKKIDALGKQVCEKTGDIKVFKEFIQ